MPTGKRGRLVRETLRGRAGAFVTDGMFRVLSASGRLHPNARPERHNIEVVRDIDYVGDGDAAHRLDIYRPLGHRGPWPVVLYIHGGGFRILSKDTHWLMALAFARRGYLVANINYRLAPRHPFPAAVEDAAAAYAWTVAEIVRYGGDPTRLVLAGESAGGNLVTSLASTACFERPEPYARKVFDTGIVPRAVVAACGLLQVSDPDRFARRRKLSSYMADRIREVSEAYLGEAAGPDYGLADPVVALERAAAQGAAPARPLPAFFAPVGTRDPLLDDTRRLRAACEALGGVCEARFYPGEVHAFHAMVLRKAARDCWHETFAFLGQYSPGAPRLAPASAGPTWDPRQALAWFGRR
jgi:acetyl esterase